MFGRKQSVLSMDDAKAILARSAVVGFGHSAGRDIYRISKNPYIIVPLFAFCGVGYAVYDLNCMRKRHRFVTWSIIFGSTLVTFYGMAVIGGLALAVPGTIIVQGLSAYVGRAIAEQKRGPLLRLKEIEATNLAFLDREGFRDVGGRLGTVIDRYGNELIPDDQRVDAFVFRITGRRSVRAYIWLDNEGQMLEYEPPPSSKGQFGSTNKNAYIDADEDSGNLSYPVNEEQARNFIEQINDKGFFLLESILQHSSGDVAGLPWKNVLEITGCRSWSGFDRNVVRPLHRKLQIVTGDQNARLLLDSADFSAEAQSEGDDRYIFIQGSAVSTFKKIFCET